MSEILHIGKIDPHFAQLRRNSREAIQYNLVLEPDIKRADDFLKQISQNRNFNQYQQGQTELLLSSILQDNNFQVDKGRRTFAILKTLEKKLKCQYFCNDFFPVYERDQIVYSNDKSNMFIWPSFSDWLMVCLGCELSLDRDKIAQRMAIIVADQERMFVGNDFCIQKELVPEYIKNSAEKVVKLLEICYNLKED